MVTCEPTDFLYPLLADIFYPMVEQGPYGNVTKHWVLDRTVAVALNPGSRKYMQQVKPNANLTLDNSLVGRSRSNILSSSRESLNAVTNVIIANVRDASGTTIYNESTGIRAGKSTIFEVSTFMPIVGPFGSVEYYSLVLSRSDNQAADI